MRSRRLPLQSSLLTPRLISIAVFLFGLVLIPVIGYLVPKTGAQIQRVNNLGSNTPTPKKNEFVPGELLVRFRSGTSMSRLKSRTSINVATAAGRNMRIDVNHFGGSEIVEGLMLARVAVEDTRAALQALQARADVQYVEPNYIRYADVVPNDPNYPSLWGLKDTGGGIFAESAWNTTTGSHNVVVGVIDSGIDIGHRDLKDNIFVNTGEIAGNNVDDDGNGFIDDVNGWDFANNDKNVFDNANDDAHGTHVAGTIGARGNNAAGVVGVNWDVQLLPMKALGPQGASDSTLLGAYSYAKMMRERGVNLRVLNNSYGGQRFSQSLFDAVKALGDAGILFVAAADNDTLDNDTVPHFPGSFNLPNVIAVASCTQQGFFSSFFSNFGNQTVHLTAPGESILSTTPRGYTGDGVVPSLTEADGSTYTNASGTSMSTPHVTGAAALVLAANPSISLQKLRAVLLFGNEDSGGFSLTITGGRLNANRTLQYALENDVTPPAPAPNFHINQQNGRSVQLFYTDSGDDGLSGNASLREIYFTDAITGEQFRLNSGKPGNPNTSTSTIVNIPYKHTSGQLSLRTTDNVGNTSTTSVDVTVPADVADPYTVTVGPAAPLTALNSGTSLNLRGDDITRGFGLPFPFPFFGTTMNGVTLSSNGALYFSIPPDVTVPNPNFGPFDFAIASQTNLQGLAMIAGMWADLRTDRNATDNVYLVQPDIDHVIFRWQGVTFGTETPVNFEIELARDGTIKTRYGSGNQNLRPVIVGISGGGREPYPIASHSSENAPLSLTNAQSVTFALRNPPPPPIADLAVSLTPNPDPVISGQNLSYGILVSNNGPSPADLVVMTHTLPAGTTFVSCTKDHVLATCTHSGGTVTATYNSLPPKNVDFGLAFTIVVKVDAAPGAALPSSVSTTSFRPDPNPANNSSSVTTYAVAQSFFSNARAIAAGRWHTTSVKTDNTVWSWGSGEHGELGDGNLGVDARSFTPLQVPGLTGVDTISESRSGSVLALKFDGTIWGWGYNNGGQLGTGGFAGFETRPVQNVRINNVKGIATGDNWAAAVKHDGTVWWWGASLSLSEDNFVVLTPKQITGITDVIAIAAGNNHLLMLKSDKTLWTAGDNSLGQLGGGPPTRSTTPVQVAGVSNVRRIAAGRDFSLALKEDGTVWAWGHNANGQLGPNGGNMGFGTPHPTPVQVTGLPAGITNLAAGEAFCLAIASDSTVWSWGANNSFQLGQGTQGSQNPTPGQVPNLSSVVAVAGGEHHSVALKADGSIWSWGLSQSGELGDGTVGAFITGTPVRTTGIEKVNAPVINPPGGRFFAAVDVTITSPTPGATVRFTTNGSDPTQNDPVLAPGATIHITSNTVVRARAWKPGMVPSGVSLVGFEQTTPSGPPVLFLDEFHVATNRLAALDSLMWTPEPFSVINPGNLLKPANDPNTRVSVFVTNLQLFAGETATAVTVSLTDANNVVHNVIAEDVRQVQGLGLLRVTFRLPNNLAPGVCQVKLISHNLNSNIGTIQITP